ncbi:MAG: hypothetical protein IKB34_06100 [Clostridia bacterium]|nr:hypothetical protein [Clostridia bacterium]
MKTKYLTYEEFGAVGDGVHDDHEAIIACHDAANLQKIPVRASDNATYYIGGKSKAAVVKTDVDFGTARFIIDDRELESVVSYVFSVESDYCFEPVEIPSLSRNQKTLDVGKMGNYLVRVYDDSHPVFIRKGLNMNNGTATQDIFLADAEGNISPSVNFDYPTVTRAEMRCTDDAPITLRGGIFTTVANQQTSLLRYHQRGIHVTRSHVTICDFQHYVNGEGDHGAPYHGFIRSDYATDLTVKDGIVTPRFTYWTESKIPGKQVPMGSYDLSFWSSIDVSCINVKQTVDITDNRYWGVYTSNFCKNLRIEGCVFSRFDAHMGVTNFVIKDCRLGHQGIQLIGFGKGVIENTQVNSAALFSLRHDYGATWTGTLEINNCQWNPRSGNTSIFIAVNEEDHDFGYFCCEPEVITISGLHVNDSGFGDKPLYLLPKFTNFSPDSEKLAPYGRVKEYYVKGLTTERGGQPELCQCPELYPEIKCVIE